jgi:Glycosyl hydrolase catalytic core
LLVRLGLISSLTVLIVLSSASIAGSPQVPIEQQHLIYGINGLGYQGNDSIQAISAKYDLVWTRVDIILTPYFAQNAYLPLIKSKVNILGILDMWLFTPGSPFANVSNDWSLANWTSAVSDAVNSYPTIHTWEIWNEPEYYQSGFLCCSTDIPRMAEDYTRMLQSAYNVIKAHNQTDIVLALGGSSISFETGDDFAFSFSKDVWADGAANYCDAISIHAYSDFEYLLNQSLTFVPQGYSQAPTMGQAWSDGLNAYENLTGKPIWITETGIPSNSWTNSNGEIIQSTVQSQAEFLTQSFGFLSSKPYVAAIFWFNLEGISDPPFNRDFGLLNMTTLEPKPAMVAFQDFANGAVARWTDSTG